MIRDDAKALDCVLDDATDCQGDVLISGEARISLRHIVAHLDPTDDQLATNAGAYVARLFGMSKDVSQVQMLVARAQHILEHRQWDAAPRDWAIVAFIAGRLGADWKDGA